VRTISLQCNILLHQIKRTNALWQQLPAASESAQACLDALSTEQSQLENEIKDYMKANAHSQQSSSSNSSNTMSSSSHTGNNTANSAAASASEHVSAAPAVAPFASKLPMPMSSPLIKYASVLLRKHEGVVKKSWAPCLVVMTVDRFLYVFDIKSNSDSIDTSISGGTSAASATTTAKSDQSPTQNNSSSDDAAAAAAVAAHTIGALSIEAAFDAILPRIDIKEPFK
jgi:hypothetical protein